ncbi:MAG: glycosyltransferase [Chitinispirillaceae bacterium]|nr:glycosyltransferase [Chitinispirillaceae bacterium]
MKILSIGTPLFSSHWRSAGHRVLVIADVALPAHEDNRPFDFFSDPQTCSQRIKEVADEFQPDIIFLGDHSTPLIHLGLESVILPKAWYSIDAHLHCRWHKHYAAIFDLVFCGQKNMVAPLSAFQSRIKWLPLFCQSPMEFKPWADRIHDVSFVGRLDGEKNPGRVRFFNDLRKKVNVHFASGNYAPVYQSSRIVVNQSVKDDLNLRFFEAVGCGALLVTDRLSHSMEDLLTPGSEFLTYTHGNVDECAEKITWAIEHPDKAKAIARSGHEKVVNRHCAQHRAKEVLEIMGALPERTEAIVDGDIGAAHLAWAYDHCSRLALPGPLTLFFSRQSEQLLPQARQSVQARPWVLLVAAGHALKKNNPVLAGALLSQIIEVPKDREFRIRHVCVEAELLLLNGDRNQAKKIAEAGLEEFPDDQEIRDLAEAINNYQ